MLHLVKAGSACGSVWALRVVWDGFYSMGKNVGVERSHKHERVIHFPVCMWLNKHPKH